MLSEREAAKYPFTLQALNLVDQLNMQIDELVDPTYEKVLDRAVERVNQAITTGEVSVNLRDPLREILSFPVAIMFVIIINENFLHRRYALAEAVRTYNLLKNENEEYITEIAVNEFNWKIKKEPENIDGVLYNLKLHYQDYLNTASTFHEPKWKLVNRKLENGYVSITGIEAARLLQVEVENHIKKRTSNTIRIKLPQTLQKRLNTIKEILDKNQAKFGANKLPDQVIIEAFPPCMVYCLQGLLAGRRASHMERFGFTSFLVNVGMSIDDMVNLYTSVSDFDESLTRYQIEHIAGIRGNRTKYTPPTCNTLRTHGICRNNDGICKTVNHPLNYYRKKVRLIQKKQEKRKETEPSNRSNPH